MWSKRKLRFYHSATLCQAGCWIPLSVFQLILTTALQERQRSWINLSSQSFRYPWVIVLSHDACSRLFGTMLRDVKSPLPWDVVLPPRLADTEGLGDCTVTELFWCLYASFPAGPSEIYPESSYHWSTTLPQNSLSSDYVTLNLSLVKYNMTPGRCQ